jgi:transcriptional regulator with XRE-family HTH domain
MNTGFPELLRAYRKGMGWTQEELSRRWSYSFETISAWERGKRRPGNQEIPRIAKFLGIDVEKLAETILNSKNNTYSQHTYIHHASNFEVWEELQNIYRTRTEFNSDFSYTRMFASAQSVLAVGISLNAIALTYSRNSLREAILDRRCQLQLCFLDPQGKKCAERELEEEYNDHILARLNEMNIRNMQLVKDRISQISPEHARLLEIRTYDMIPRYNIYIVDNTLMTVQSYAYTRGEDTPTFVLIRRRSGGLFDFYASAAHYILAHSKEINPQDYT